MEFVITSGQFQVAPIPGEVEGSRAGYIMNVTDQLTGIIVRVSMQHKNAAELGRVLVEDTDAHPAWEPTNITVVPESALHALPDPPQPPPA